MDDTTAKNTNSNNTHASPRSQHPHAWYEDRACDFTLVTKLLGRLFKTERSHSVFDVVGWHGNCEGQAPPPLFFLDISHIIQLTPQKLRAVPRNSASAEARAVPRTRKVFYIRFLRW